MNTPGERDEDEDQPPSGAGPYFYFLLLVSIGALGLTAYLAYRVSTIVGDWTDIQKVAQFGDSMAAAGLVLTGLGLFFTALSLALQRNDLKVQIYELKKSSAAQDRLAKAQNEMVKKQSELLESQRKSTEALELSAGIQERYYATQFIGELQSRVKKRHERLGRHLRRCEDLREECRRQFANQHTQPQYKQKWRELLNRAQKLCQELKEQYERSHQTTEAREGKLADARMNLGLEDTERTRARKKLMQEIADWILREDREFEKWDTEHDAIKGEQPPVK